MVTSTPKIIKTRRRQFRIADGMLDILVAEVGLQGASVMPLVGRRVAGGVPKHVRAGLEPKLRYSACPLHHARKPGRTLASMGTMYSHLRAGARTSPNRRTPPPWVPPFVRNVGIHCVRMQRPADAKNLENPQDSHNRAENFPDAGG